MNNERWFGCPICHLTFYTKGEYERHYKNDHPRWAFRPPDLIESKE